MKKITGYPQKQTNPICCPQGPTSLPSRPELSNSAREGSCVFESFAPEGVVSKSRTLNQMVAFLVFLAPPQKKGACPFLDLGGWGWGKWNQRRSKSFQTRFLSLLCLLAKKLKTENVASPGTGKRDQSSSLDLGFRNKFSRKTQT